jgi:putative ABC transport system ATP-binding protein
MLQMVNVSKVYRTEIVETHALADLSVHVRRGEFVAVMGPSGSGKTTFLNVAGLLDSFQKGEYLLDGVDVRRLRDGAMSRIRNRKIGFVFQGFNLMPDLDVFDNVDVPLRYRRLKPRERRERIERALEQVGLASRMRHVPSQLSGGQQQRVAIARVLAGDPALILADEPTGNLDSVMSHEILELLENINEAGTTIVMVTHSAECAAHAHRQIHLRDGRMVEVDEPPSLVRGREPSLVPGIG